MRTCSVSEHRCYAGKSGGFATNKGGRVAHSDMGTQYCQEYPHYKLALANMQWSSGHNDMCQGLSGASAHGSYASKATALVRRNKQCLILWPMYTLLPRLSYCQMGYGNMLSWICYSPTENLYQWFSGAPEPPIYASKCSSFATNQQANVWYPNTAIQYRLDWLCCHMGLVSTQWSICPDETDDICCGFSPAPESRYTMLFWFFWLCNA